LARTRRGRAKVDRRLGAGSDAQQQIEPQLVVASARDEKLEKNALRRGGQDTQPYFSFSGIPRPGRPCLTLSYLPYAKYAHNQGARQYRVLAGRQEMHFLGWGDPRKNVAAQ